MNLPLMLKADSEAMVGTGIAKMSLAINCKVGYFKAIFQQLKISKLAFIGNIDFQLIIQLQLHILHLTPTRSNKPMIITDEFRIFIMG